MATLIRNTIPNPNGSLRTFDVLHDLAAVADLVEQCFADTLDSQGEQYLKQMRSVAQSPGYSRWLTTAIDGGSVPMMGYVWEDAGQIVGNVNLIPYLLRGQRRYLIANVAVHPAYRRRGIARALTAEAVEFVHRRGLPSVWLHVRAENSGAVALYRSLQFQERARRSTWYSLPATGPLPAPLSGAEIQVTPRRDADWPAQKEWLQRNYPEQLAWHLPIQVQLLRPGLLAAIYRYFINFKARHWIAWQAGQRVGAITWQPSRTYGDPLWLAPAVPEAELVTYKLLVAVRGSLDPGRRLTLDYPAGQGDAAIRAAGFALHQTLIWMERTLR